MISFWKVLGAKITFLDEAAIFSKKCSDLLLQSFFTVQCDQMAWLFFNICPFATIEMCPKAHTKFAIVAGSKFLQMLNQFSKNCIKQFKIGQICKIWPNLVILFSTNVCSSTTVRHNLQLWNHFNGYLFANFCNTKQCVANKQPTAMLTEMKHFNWLKLVTWLSAANQCGLFQLCYSKLVYDICYWLIYQEVGF